MAGKPNSPALSWRLRPSEATTLQEIIPDTPQCSACSGQGCWTLNFATNRSRPLTHADAKTGLNGRIAFLPNHNKANLSQSFASQGINSGAFNHPCVIVETSPCQHLVFCLQVTSFEEATIQAKYRHCGNVQTKADMFNEYVAFKQPDTVAHNQHELLEYDGPAMPKQSYVHLEFGFWIEWRNLNSWLGGFLKPGSLSTITKLYAAAEAKRQSFGSQSTARLARSVVQPGPTRIVSPPVLGKRQLSDLGIQHNNVQQPTQGEKEARVQPAVRLSWRENAAPTTTATPIQQSKRRAMESSWRRGIAA